MKLDPGLIIVIIAALVFYLRLIILQRERAKQARNRTLNPSKKAGKKAAVSPPPAVRYSLLSQNRRDWIIAGTGVLLVILGILLFRNIIPIPWVRNLWWLPTAAGILAFSWGFK